MKYLCAKDEYYKFKYFNICMASAEGMYKITSFRKKVHTCCKPVGPNYPKTEVSGMARSTNETFFYVSVINVVPDNVLCGEVLEEIKTAAPDLYLNIKGLVFFVSFKISGGLILVAASPCVAFNKITTISFF